MRNYHYGDQTEQRFVLNLCEELRRIPWLAFEDVDAFENLLYSGQAKDFVRSASRRIRRFGVLSEEGGAVDDLARSISGLEHLRGTSAYNRVLHQWLERNG